jgi:WD40 repeat protein
LNVLFSPDSATLALREPDQVRLWETRTGTLRGSIPVAANSMAFSPDGYTLATASATPKERSLVTLWDLNTLRPRLELPAQANSLAFSRDGRTLVTFHSDQAMLWDLESRAPRATLKLSRELPSLAAYFWPMAFSPDGKLFGLADDLLVHLWDTTTGNRLATLKGHRDRVHRLAFSPDGKTLATASGAFVKLWNLATHEEVTTLMGPNTVGDLAFAPDGSLAVGYHDNSIHLWRTGSDPGQAPPGK